MGSCISLPTTESCPYVPMESHHSPPPNLSPTANDPNTRSPLWFCRSPFPGRPDLTKRIRVALRLPPKANEISKGLKSMLRVGLKLPSMPKKKARFGFSKGFKGMLELGDEFERGSFGYACPAVFKRGEFQGRTVAVKVLPKSKIETDLSVEDVQKEVNMLRALSERHENLVKFYQAFEDRANVYMVMELCEGSTLLNRLADRGGTYPENYAKSLLVQLLNAVAFIHLQGVVHRDLKLENVLYTSMDANGHNSPIKVIDFGGSEFVGLDGTINEDVMGSRPYLAPEVINGPYGKEADVWSIGVIAYCILQGYFPFDGSNDDEFSNVVQNVDPDFNVAPWPSLSMEVKDFVGRLLDKNPKSRLTAAQALCHPWIRRGCNVAVKVPLDVLMLKQMKIYMESSSFRKDALKSLSKTLNEDQMFYLRGQFALLEPEDGIITFENFSMVMKRNQTDLMNESRILDNLLPSLTSLRMDFEEFRAAAMSVQQVVAFGQWEQRARSAYEFFENDGNRVFVIEDIVPEHELVLDKQDADLLVNRLKRPNDGKLNFFGFVTILRQYT